MSEKRENFTQAALEQGRFTSIPNALINDTGLSPQERFAWIVIAHLQCGERFTTKHEMRQIATVLGLHVRSARRNIHALEAKGYLRITERQGMPNAYELRFRPYPSVGDTSESHGSMSQGGRDV